MTEEAEKNRAKYADFCGTVYVPLYSKPWWLDAVVGTENWDVWLYEEGGSVVAAMPYYYELRKSRKYITKAPLTQNNGIIFKHNENSKYVAKALFEEKVIEAVCEYIESLGVDVYEQQYQTSFTNWLPFYWNSYTAIPRYTYVIEDTSDLDAIWENVTSKRRSVIRKGQKNSTDLEDLDIDTFYNEHEKIYLKQGLKCPFTYDVWKSLAEACLKHNSGKISCRRAPDGNIASVSFVAWDEKSLYKLMGGPIPDYAKLDAYGATTWDEIKLAHELGVSYDFEGSVIKRISKPFREFGAVPKQYFRIRKVLNPDIVMEEANLVVKKLKEEE